MTTVIYPGTFDPITRGHTHIIERAAVLFSQVIVAIAADVPKQTLFSPQERLQLATSSLKHLPQVEVCLFHGLLAGFARQKKIDAILRGTRAIADFEFERQMALMNQQLSPGLETLFMTPLASYAHVSASLVREIAALKGDVSAFVDPRVAEALAQKFSHP